MSVAGSPVGVRARTRRWGGNVVLVARGGVLDVEVDGVSALATGEFMVSMGSPPSWWQGVEIVREVLARCPGAPLARLIALVGSARRVRHETAAGLGETSPRWLWWACALDEDTRSVLVRHMPLGGAGDAVAAEVLSWPRSRRAARDRLRQDESARVWAAMSEDMRVFELLVSQGSGARVCDEGFIVEVARLRLHDVQAALLLAACWRVPRVHDVLRNSRHPAVLREIEMYGGP